MKRETRYLAKIKWLSPSEGGRNSIPSGPKYIAPSRFGQDIDDRDEQAWSLVVNYVSKPNKELEHTAHVHFLIKDAPENLLIIGNAFGLYEGHRLVAKGKILSAE
jgi:hypothetical protein